MAWICVFLVISFTDWDPMGLMHHHQIIINFGESVLPHDGSMGQLVRIFTYMNGGFFMVKLCRQIDQSHGSVMATFCRHRVCHANPRIHQTFQVPKMEESKLYGSGLCKGKPIPQIAPNKVFSETLHFGYLRLFGEGYLHLTLQEVHQIHLIHPSSSLCGVDFCWAL